MKLVDAVVYAQVRGFPATGWPDHSRYPVGFDGKAVVKQRHMVAIEEVEVLRDDLVAFLRFLHHLSLVFVCHMKYP